MNAITRVYGNSIVRSPAARQQRTSWGWSSRILIALIILSAFALVYLKDLNRREFIRYQEMARANQQAHMDWEKLLLERSTWAAQANVQNTASQRLHMYTPDAKEIVLLTQ
jgi:cell division protein FtsL